MHATINWPHWNAKKQIIEDCLKDGFAPIGVGGGKGSCIGEAARRLALTGYTVQPNTVSSWAKVQERRATRGLDNALPNWKLFNGASKGGGESRQARSIRRWLLTSAQDDTRVHGAFLENLKAFADYVGAEIAIAPFTYNKSMFTDHETRHASFAEEVRPYLQFDRMECGSVVFFAEMNTLPTATRPLSGLHSYTRGRSGVFPHAKLALESIPAMPGARVPIIMTTGACTVENYIAKKAGLKAAFHHVIGATLVEEDADGRTFCRQINATEDGSFQDLTLFVRDGNVTTGHRVEAITWGDIHRRKLNRMAALASFGFDPDIGTNTSSDSMLDELRPRYQFFHDVLDFETRNHHNDNNPHERFRLFSRGQESLSEEIAEAAAFMRSTSRDWSKSVVVESNHDLWIEGWLRKADYRHDPVNALFFLRMQLACYEAREREEDDFSVFRHAMQQADPTRLAGIQFSPENGSYRICHERGGGVECGSHGHLGPNGSRGTAASLLKISAKMNRGHEHSISIYDSIFTAGVLGDLDMGYNKGPSSWTHSNIVTYPTGKRAIVTLDDGKWRA